MNWMRICLRRQAGCYALLGGIAGGGSAWFYLYALQALPEGFSPRGAAIAGGMVLGLTLCGFSAPADDLYHRLWLRAIKTGLCAAAAAAVVGAFSFILLDLLTPLLNGVRWLVFPFFFGLCGAIVGADRLWGGFRQMRRRILAGGLLGLLCGFLPLVLLAVMENPAMWVLGCACWGGVVVLILFWGRKRRARRWLRVLTGPAEDDFYPLPDRDCTLGKFDRNDIALRGYSEVFPYHCRLYWEGGRYRILHHELGGVVLVNFRQAQDQVLEPGDLIKLGTALLQYGEA